MLRKGIIKEKISNAEYLVEDIFEEEIFKMRVSGKQRLNYKGFEIGEEVYFICSPYDSSKCRWITATDFKMDDSNSLFGKKLELDKKHKERKEASR